MVIDGDTLYKFHESSPVGSGRHARTENALVLGGRLGDSESRRPGDTRIKNGPKRMEKSGHRPFYV